MLLVDDRIGSKDLLSPLQQYGVDCDLQHLEYGDFAFIGRGVDNADVTIGIELKETRDLLSSMRSARFAGHQLPGLVETYDRVWLVTEGIWRTTADGILEIMQGGWKAVSLGRQPIMAADLDSWILSQVIRGGIHHWHCSTRRDTIRFIATLYRWWTDKSLDEHRSHQAIYLPPPDRASLVEPSAFLKMASCLPKVGWEKGAALESSGARFQLTDAAGKLLTAKELQGIPGIGPTIAHRILAVLNAGSAAASTIPS